LARIADLWLQIKPGTDAGGPCISIVQRALPPLGEVKTDVEIAIGLRDKLRARGLIQFDLMPWNTHRELINFQLAGTELTFEDLCEQGFHKYPFVYEEYRTKGFKTASKKIELSSERLTEAGHDPLPDYHPPTYAMPEAGFDLILITGIRSMAFHHSRFRNHEWARKIQSAPELRIHPKTAEQSQIRNDDWVWVETPHGAGDTLLKAKLTDEVPMNVVATGYGLVVPGTCRRGSGGAPVQYRRCNLLRAAVGSDFRGARGTQQRMPH
jgi:thiosulfate reductase / polysulfide reductase chain A